MQGVKEMVYKLDNMSLTYCVHRQRILKKADGMQECEFFLV